MESNGTAQFRAAARSLRVCSVRRPIAALSLLALLGTAVLPAPIAAQCPPDQLFPTHTALLNSAQRHGVQIADLDADGLGDIIAPEHGSSGKVKVVLGAVLPAPTILEYTTTVNKPFRTVTGDFNEDGILDFVVSGSSGHLNVFLGNGAGGISDGTFTLGQKVLTADGPRGMAVADFNEDGILDLAVSMYFGGYLVVIGKGVAGVGDGTFESPVIYDASKGSFEITAADVDEDGIMDLVTANIDQVRVHRGNGAGGVGDGTFLSPTAYSIFTGALSVQTADLDQDGILDLALSGYSAGQGVISVLRGNGSSGVGDGTFANPIIYPAGVVPYQMRLVDVSMDGLPDAVTADYTLGVIMVVPGNGDGTFGPAVPYGPGTRGIAVAVGPIDNDLSPDVVMGTTESSIFTFLNVCSVGGPPVITTVTPGSGAVGDPVLIEGLRLGDVTSVTFAGTPAQILTQTGTSIGTEVPAGASSGPIEVTSPTGSSESPNEFFVGFHPLIADITPLTAKIGEPVVISGNHFATTVRVSFGGGASDANFSIDGNQQLTAYVDSAAIDGPITVTNQFGSSMSTAEFVVAPPDTAPSIVAIRDVPNDQGGRVFVDWVRSDFDTPEHRLIKTYRVWRRANPSVATSARRLVRMAAPGAVTVEFWEPLADLPAAHLEGYSYMAATSQDSIENSNPLTAFMVQAVTVGEGTFFFSAPDSGYSVDNLAPAAPAVYAGRYDSRGVHLHWSASDAPDFREYRIYRGTAATFTPGAANLIAAKPDTGHVDASGGPLDYYKLSAVDIHGNESPRVLISPAATQALATLGAVSAESDHVRIEWLVSFGSGVPLTVSRRTETSDWQALASVEAAADGHLTFEDADVQPGTRYAYRLSLELDGRVMESSEVWVRTSLLALALAGIHPNPTANGELHVAFSLPAEVRARLDLLDVSGRRVATRDVSTFGTGSHTLNLGAGVRLAPGMYVVRLTDGKQVLTSRVTILR